MWFDILSLGLVLLLAIKGVINGFIKEVFGLVGIIGGLYLASRYASQMGRFIDANLFEFGNRSVLYIVGFLVVLLSFWLTCLFIGFLLSRLISMSGLGALNRIAGFLVGGAKIFFIFSVLFLTISNITFINEILKEHLKHSFMYHSFIKTGSFIVNTQPDLIKKTKNITIQTKENIKELSEPADQNQSTKAKQE